MRFIVVLENGETWEEISSNAKVMSLSQENFEKLVSGECYPKDLSDEECATTSLTNVLNGASLVLAVQDEIENLATYMDKVLNGTGQDD